MHGAGPVEQTFPGRGRGSGLAQAAGGVGVALVVVALGGGSRASTVAALLALAYAAAAFLLLARPAVLLRTQGFTLRGEVTDAEVAWAALGEVEAGPTGLRVVAGDRVLRAHGFGGSPPGVPAHRPGAVPAPDPAVEAYCAQVADALRAAARRQREQAGPAASPDAPVGRASQPPQVRLVRRWDLLAVPVALLLAAAALALS